MATHSSKDIQKAATLFFQLRSRIRSALAQGQRLDPYAWLRIETMVYIRDHEGTRARDIAEYLCITAPSVTSLLSLLARGGLITRKPDPTDRRAQRIYLSKKGSGFLAGTVRKGVRLFGSFFKSLSRDELAAFSAAIECMLESK